MEQSRKCGNICALWNRVGYVELSGIYEIESAVRKKYAVRKSVGCVE